MRHANPTSILPAKKLAGLALSLIMGLQVLMSPAMAEDRPLHVPAHPPTPKPRTAIRYSPDILLVMPDAKADKDDVNQALEDAHGTVIGTIGEGKLRCLIVKTEKGQLEETEKKLKKDKKDFRCMSRDYTASADWVPNDPSFASEWHLAAINAPRAWNNATGAGTSIAVFDTGCQASNPDLSGKTSKGYDANDWFAHILPFFGGPSPMTIGMAGAAGLASSGAQNDVNGHGTWVATTCAATANNSTDTAGVAPGSSIYPVRIAGSGGTTDDLAIMAGLLNAMATGHRIVNISYGAYPPFGFTNAGLHAPLHMYFQFFHDLYGGIIFISAGNDGAFDPDPNMYYLNVVSAIDNSYSLTNFSNWGASITFTAPGKGIVVSDRSGNVVSVDGTSFSSPICASVAALVWNANPALPNVAVETILKASCFRPHGAAWTPYFGYGMPNADAAVRMARGG